jgi:hypothetical protein
VIYLAFLFYPPFFRRPASFLSSRCFCFSISDLFSHQFLHVVWRVCFIGGHVLVQRFFRCLVDLFVIWYSFVAGIILGPSLPNIYLIVCVLGSFASLLVSAAIIVLKESVIITMSVVFLRLNCSNNCRLLRIKYCVLR